MNGVSLGAGASRGGDGAAVAVAAVGAAGGGVPVPLTISVWPTRIVVPDNPFNCWMAATVVSQAIAIAYSVSPLFTTYVTVPSACGWPGVLLSLGASAGARAGGA